MNAPLRKQPAVDALLQRFPGAEIVDVRQASDLSPPAGLVPNAGRNFSLRVLRQLAIDEASRIEAAQDALVAAGDRAEPDPLQLAKRDGFEAISRLIDRVAGDEIIKDRLRQLGTAPAPSRGSEGGA